MPDEPDTRGNAPEPANFSPALPGAGAITPPLPSPQPPTVPLTQPTSPLPQMPVSQTSPGKKEPLLDPRASLRTYARDLATASGKPIPESPLSARKTLQEAVAEDAARMPSRDSSGQEPDTWQAPPPPTGRTPSEILADLKGKGWAPERAPTVVSLDEERGSILERLYAKQPEQQTPPHEPPPPIPLMDKKEARERGPSPVHTFTTDIAERIETKNVDRFAALAAEQDARIRAPELLKPRTSPLPILAGIALIFLGALGIYFAYLFATDAPPIPVVAEVPSIIFADGHVELTGEPPLLPKLAEAAGLTVPEGNVVVTYVTSATTTETGILTTPEPGGTLLTLLGLNAPDVLLRNIEDISTVGVVAAGGETRAFFILRVSSFERTFAGMLSWETRMADDLALLYPPYEPEALPIIEVATSAPTSIPPVPAASSSVPLTGLDLGPDEFVDEVVLNHDVRVLYDESGRVLMLYGYRDRHTLIIVRNKAAFGELLTRLSATRQN